MSGEASKSAGSSSNAIPIASLSVEELDGLRQKVEIDVQRFQSSKLQLTRVLNAFESSETAIDRLSTAQEGDELLLPLSDSLYVNGRVASTKNVVIDIGTGYFVERSVEEATDYCQRKSKYLSENIKQVDQVLLEKQKALSTITQVLEGKIREQSTEGSPA